MQDLGNISIPSKNPQRERKDSSTVLMSQPKSKHSSHRSNRRFFINHKYSFLILLISILVGWIYYVPPSNDFAVLAFILLITGIFSILFSHFGQKAHVFSTFFIFIFLLMSYFIGFDLINTLVLLSFIIGLSTLFKTTKAQ